MGSEFKVFYSWQSDLIGKDTRNFIGEVIKNAVKFLSNTVTVIPDRDTQGELGSPNIETTIFQKIDECDLFIADLSIVCEYEDSSGNKKYAPNPNVLIELGYAVKVLSWERVICFVNTDYGKETELPFDLNHHRVTGYSLHDNEKSEVKKALRDIISTTVINLMENGPRIKKGFAGHIVGSYFPIDKNVKKEVAAVKIQSLPFVENYKNELLNKARTILESAVSKVIQPIEEDAYNKFGEGFNLNILNWQKVIIKEEDEKCLKEDAKKYLDMELEDSFFELGDLERRAMVAIGMSTEYRGSDEAQEKYDQINKVMGIFGQIQIFEEYLKTFSGMIAIPLAIWNNTTVTDADINVSIIIDRECANVVEPDENMINAEIRDIAGLVYEQHFIEKLFELPEDENISKADLVQIKTNAEFKEEFARTNYNPLFGYKGPDYDMDDYVDEIKKYIAQPRNKGGNEFDFYIKKLRANEKNWFGKFIILNPKKEEIRISYKITSEKTAGNLEGELVCVVGKV